ncbi:MAG: LacI family DNA-binding transcriptional regulator [Candidatus Nanopelagicales bacterium]
MGSRLADIAASAGVSEATVSRVLNDRPGVSAATRRAVLTAVDVLGYDRPVRLRPRGRPLVGLVVPELVNPIFPEFAQVIQTLLAHSGYTPLLCTQTPGGVSEDAHVDMLLELGVSGVVFVSGEHADVTSDHARYRALVDQGLPIVLVNGHAADVDAPSVSDDDAAAMDLAVGHLAALGHHRIGLAVGPERFVPVVRKREGFLRALQDHLGVAEDEGRGLVVSSLFSVEGGQAAAQTLLARGVTAVVCGSDLMALGAVRAVRGAGLSVPDDVSVVGYDDSPLVAFTDPPLTTVRQAVPSMADAAVQALVDQMGGSPTPRTEYVFRPELVVRASTGAAPVR